jgi:hypothetical protein
VAAAAPEAVWTALLRTASSSFGGRAAEGFARVVGCRDPTAEGDPGLPGSTVVGFRVTRAERPRALTLEGEHRFSRYALDFEIEPEGSGARVSATTRAEFPGLHGRAYRALVIGSRGHVVVVRRLLQGIKTRAERPGSRAAGRAAA